MSTPTTSSVSTADARTQFAAKIRSAISVSCFWYASASPAARKAYLPGGECRRRRRWRLCFVSIAGSRSMKYPRKQKARALLSEFSSTLGSEILKVRIYRDREAFVCERELVERDGTSFTMVLPFRNVDTARTLLAADPYYARVRGEVWRALGKLAKAVRENDGKPVP